MKLLGTLIMTAVLSFSACALEGGVEELATGRYVMQGTQMPEWAWVLLEEDNQFVFNRNLATSYRPGGTYSVEKGTLVLTVHDNEVYTFRIEGSDLVFESGQYAERLVPKGSVFRRMEEE